MAITGFEVDILRNTTDGKVEHVPCYEVPSPRVARPCPALCPFCPLTTLPYLLFFSCMCRQPH